jgi:hypothetical protein
MKVRLTEAAILDILTSPESHRVLAERYGCHHSAVAHVREGRTHAKVLPEIARRSPGRNCVNCQHWRHASRECDLGLPDPLIEGLRFAGNCTTYREATD